MAVEYKWTFGPMMVETVEGIANVVTGIQWNCTAIDPEVSATINGMDSGMLKAPEVDPVSYVTLEELTDAEVNAWIESGLNKPAIEARVLGMLNDQLNPPIKFVEVPPGINTSVPLTTDTQEQPTNPPIP